MLHNHLGRRAPRAVAAAATAAAAAAAGLPVAAAHGGCPRAAGTRAFASKPPSRPAAAPSSDGRSFQGQMLESISARLAREKAQREQLARERQESASTRNAATTFMLLFVGAVSYYLGRKTPQEADPASTLPLAATRPPRHHTGRAELEAAWADFVGIVGADNVSTDAGDVAAHVSSEWSSHQVDDEAGTAAASPFCVVYPRSTEEVSAVLKVCHARRIPVTGFSGGTSLEGHFAPTRGGIVVDFARHMDRVLAVHAEDLDAVVQPGVGWQALNEALAEQGLFFPPDPGPGAQIGGMVGTGCSGMNAFRYGTMRDWVLALTVVLADGTVVRTRQRPRKSSAGYDLTRLLVGSEGTLGLVTEATLKLTVLPRESSVALAAFPDLRAAGACAARVVAAGIPVAAMELLDDRMMAVLNEAADKEAGSQTTPGGKAARRWLETPTLLFKFAGSSAAAVREQVDAVRAAARAAQATAVAFARTPAEADELWAARKNALWSVMATKRPADRVWTGDVAVPVSRLPDAVAAAQADLRARGLRGTVLGHVGDGNFHTIVLYGPDERPAAEAFVHDMVKRAIAHEGTVTGEHGVGLVKRDYLPHELGEDTVAAMRKIKAALDPLCLLNCDKVLRMQNPKPGEVAEW